LDKERARDYHITATKFDEPGAVRLATASVLGIGIHGQREGSDVICLGGRNAELRKRTAAALREDGFSVEEPCKRLPGESAKNIANRPSDGGIQLEFSQKILKRLTENGPELVKFCAALKDSVNGYFLQKQSKVIPAESGGFSTGADGVKP
ncbi:MAG: poly-gamma-glutamate hydrolase family protein, partial [Elusimicrobiaceae bacterium]